jgi:short-subunit dehydrogenase
MSFLEKADRRKVVFITGASSGIGAALASEFARRGANVALLARREDRIQALAKELSSRFGIRAIALRADVTDPQALNSAVQKTIQELGGIDIAIANAGFAVSDRMEKLKQEDYRRQFDTNVFGVLNTIYGCLDELKKSQGSIAIMGSVAGYISLPLSTPYCMSKSAVRALSYGIRHELKKYGISVTLISPGFVESEITRVDNRGVVRQDNVKEVPSFLMARADRAARNMARAILARRREIIITGHGKILAWMSRYFPRTVDFAMGLSVEQYRRS